MKDGADREQLRGEDRHALGLGGLCPGCAHVHPVRSARGSVFLRCRLASTDPRFPKYPPQPVARCAGHTPAPPRDP